jgi:hypothetical protein
VRHEAEVCEDDETGKEAGETVDSSGHETVPVTTGTKEFNFTWLTICYAVKKHEFGGQCTYRY